MASTPHKSISSIHSSGDPRSSKPHPKPSSSSSSSLPSPHLLLIELKQRIISSLNKLADRDTQHIAVDELERIAESLTPEGISLCLSCLYDTDTQQKCAVRKECVRMFGTLASLHEDHLSPHLSKIVMSIVKRLRDPDSSIRDACVDAMGTLAAKVCPPNATGLGGGGGGENTNTTTMNAFPGSLGVFAKPLFDVLNEQGRSAQVGAAMCLAEVIDNLKDLPPSSLQRICPRIIKLLNSPTFTAKASLLAVISSIVQAGGAASQQCLAMVMACIQECLKSNDWSTRKAASETLACMASSNNCLNLSAFKSSVLESLEGCRFDKVKPVRDMVIQTQHIWKRMPDSDSGTDAVSAFKENTCSDSKDNVKSKRKLEGVGGEVGTVLKNVDQNNSDSEALDFGCFGFNHARSGANRIHSEPQKRRVPLLDKRANAHGFARTAKKDIWQIEIAVPLGAHDDTSISKKTIRERKTLQERVAFGRIVDHHLELLETSDRRQTEESSEKTNSSDTCVESHGFKESACMSSTKCRSLISKRNSCADSSSQYDEIDMGSWSAGQGTVESSSSSMIDSQASISENDSLVIRRQLCHIESQQTAILELLQKFMNHTEESLLKLEARIASVESSMANLLKDVSHGNCDSHPGRCSSKLHDTSDQLSSKYTSTKQWPVSSECLPSLRNGRKSPQRSPRIGMGFAGIEELRFGSGNGHSDTQHNSWRPLSSDTLQQWSRIGEAESNGSYSGSIQEASLTSSRHGESSTGGRSIRQASKDEGGIAAASSKGIIEAGRMKISESLKVTTKEQQQEVKVQRIGGGGQQQKGPFWSLWARAAEFLRCGDVDSAYVEVLCAGDELLLVRLMSRTGPVLQQLSEGTIHELMRNVIQLMSQQSFLDVIIPWLQQVADTVINNGFSLSLDTKRDLMASLQEASTSNYPEKWIAARLHELALQLATAWGLS